MKKRGRKLFIKNEEGNTQKTRKETLKKGRNSEMRKETQGKIHTSEPLQNPFLEVLKHKLEFLINSSVQMPLIKLEFLRNSSTIFRSSLCFLQKAVLKNLMIFTGKQLWWGLFFIKVADLQAYNFIKKKLQHSCFLTKFVKFLRTTFLRNTSGDCFCGENRSKEKKHHLRIF